MKRDTRCGLIIITILTLSIGVWAQDQPAPPTNLNPPVLRVNGDTIYAAEVSMVMANIAGQLRAQGREAPDQKQLVQMATQRVVEQKLLAQEARRQGYKPNDLRVAEMAKKLEQQGGGREQLNQALASRGSGYDQLMMTIKEMDLVRTLIEKQISPAVSVTEEEIATYLADNPGIFDTPAEVHARHIIFNAGETADADTIINARDGAEKARERAFAGEDFAALARELSQGPSAPQGGDLGFFAYQQMVPSFAEAAFALEPGEISDVVRTNFGFHLIKVEEKTDAVVPSLEESKDQARRLLIQQKSAVEVQDLIRTLGETATLEPLVAASTPESSPATSGQPE